MNRKKSSKVHANKILLMFAANVNAGNEYEDMIVILQNDLDMSGVEGYIPIGNYEGDFYFKGIFDGKGTYNPKFADYSSEWKC